MVSQSDAVFSSWAKEIGLDVKVLQPLKDAGFTSIATFAFSCAYIPGTADQKNTFGHAQDCAQAYSRFG